jgi:Chaperonin 10 Kd subunit
MSAVHDLAGRTIGGPLTPISNAVLVQVKDKASATESGVILLEKTLERPTEGVVVAQGPGMKHPESGLEVSFCTLCCCRSDHAIRKH